jgi:hypothetical protein
VYKKEFEEEADLLLSQYQLHLEFCQSKGKVPQARPDLERFADIAFKTRVATLNIFKLDQQINQAYSNECYNNIHLITGEWQKAYFNVELEYSNSLLPTTKTTMKRKSKATQLKEDFHTIIQQLNSKEWYIGESPIDRIRRTNPLAYQAATLLNEAMMDRLGYNVKKVEYEVTLASNEGKQSKFMHLVNNEFKQGQRYPTTKINEKLDAIYTLLDIRDVKTGKVKKAKATDLATLGLFDIDTCKLADKKGKYTIHGYELVRTHLNIQAAA